MENGIMFLEDKLAEIYYLYEFHVWQNEGFKINILYEDNTINISLTKGEEIIDNYSISFGPPEEEIYEYLALSLFNVALGCVEIHKKGDYTFMNKVHRPYLDFKVTDKAILYMIDLLVDNQYQVHINEGFEEICPYIPYDPLDKKTFNMMELRTELTKKRLKESIK